MNVRCALSAVAASAVTSSWQPVDAQPHAAIQIDDEPLSVYALLLFCPRRRTPRLLMLLSLSRGRYFIIMILRLHYYYYYREFAER